MPSRLRKIINGTIFRPIPYPPQHPNEILAAYYNRTAFTLYSIYFFWGLAAIPGTIAVLVDTVPDWFGTWMSLIILPLAFFSAWGALRFPHTARLELFSASAFTVIVIIYLIIYVIRIFNGSDTAATGVILSTQYLVVPVSRVVFIYNTLVRNAKTRGQG